MPLRPFALLRSPWRLALAVLAVVSGTQALADEPRRMGWLEWSWLEPGHVRLKTKLDTGARTSSLHAEDIATFERDGETWVRFRVPLQGRHCHCRKG